MDPSLTYGDPGYVKASEDLTFYFGGIWLEFIYLDHINFSAMLNGVQVFNVNVPYGIYHIPGSWTTSLSYHIPPVVPKFTYYITVTAKGMQNSDETLWILTTDFYPI